MAFCIEQEGFYTYRLKDWENPATPKDMFGKPKHVTGRFRWVGPLRDDYTRFPDRAEAEATLAILQSESPDMKLLIRAA